MIKHKKLVQKIILFVTIAIMFILEFGHVKITSDDDSNSMLLGTISRILGVVIISILFYDNLKNLTNFKGCKIINLLIIFPCLIIAINNFPFIEYIKGEVKIVNLKLLPYFIAECLSIGLFEEMIFRGVIFTYLLKNKTENKKQIFMAIFYSSIAFGLVHLFNLLGGASFGSVLLQIGYSSLIGAMLCFVLLTTKNIWICIAIHSIYDFCGQIIPILGEGTIFTTPSIIFTAIVSVIITLYIILIFIKKPLPYAKEIVID